jgi:hypothetical protein
MEAADDDEFFARRKFGGNFLDYLAGGDQVHPVVLAEEMMQQTKRRPIDGPPRMSHKPSRLN